MSFVINIIAKRKKKKNIWAYLIIKAIIKKSEGKSLDMFI